eukprot:SAG11_NODE_3136_length_2662_cov_3.598908_1_plen_305_part_00
MYSRTDIYYLRTYYICIKDLLYINLGTIRISTTGTFKNKYDRLFLIYIYIYIYSFRLFCNGTSMVIVIEAAMAAASTLPTNALQPIRRSAKEDAYPTNGCQITNCDDDKTKTTGLLTCRFRCLNQRSLAPKFGCETLPDDWHCVGLPGLDCRTRGEAPALECDLRLTDVPLNRYPFVASHLSPDLMISPELLPDVSDVISWRLLVGSENEPGVFDYSTSPPMVKTKFVEEGGALRLCDALQDDQFPHSTAVLALISVQTDYFIPAMTSVIAKINSGHDAFLSVERGVASSPRSEAAELPKILPE